MFETTLTQRINSNVLITAKGKKNTFRPVSQKKKKKRKTEEKKSIIFLFPAVSILGLVHNTLEKFENAALFLKLGLMSTLMRHKNEAFRERFSIRRNLKTPAFVFCVDGKLFENGAFRKWWRHDYHVISLTEFSSNRNPKWPVIVVL